MDISHRISPRLQPQDRLGHAPSVWPKSAEEACIHTLRNSRVRPRPTLTMTLAPWGRVTCVARAKGHTQIIFFPPSVRKAYVMIAFVDDYYDYGKTKKLMTKEMVEI